MSSNFSPDGRKGPWAPQPGGPYSSPICEGATVASSGRDKVSELQGDPALGALVGVYFQIAENSKTMSDLEMSTEISRFAKDLEAQIEQVRARYNL